MLSLPRASQSLVRELRSYMPCSSANKINKSKSAFPLNFQKMISIIYPNNSMQWSGINPFLPPGNLPPHLLHFHSNEKSLQKTLVFIKIFFQWNVTTLNTSSSVFVCRLWILYTYVFVLSHPSNLHLSLLVSLFSIPYWFNKFNPTSISWMPNATVSRSDPQSSPALRPTTPFGLTPLLFFNILNTSLPQGLDFAALSSKISSSLFCRFPQVSSSEIKSLPLITLSPSPLHLEYSWAHDRHSVSVSWMGSAVMRSVQFNRSVMSNSLWPHGLQRARLPSPSPSPGACSNSRPLSRWWHPTISSYVVPFCSCLQSFPASGSFPMSQFFTLGGRNIGASVSASVLPMTDFL